MWTSRLYALAGVMLITGTINTVATKMQDMVVTGRRPDGSPQTFDHPLFQSALMFLGESMCFVLYMLSSHVGSRRALRRAAESGRRGARVAALRMLGAGPEAGAPPSSAAVPIGGDPLSHPLLSAASADDWSEPPTPLHEAAAREAFAASPFGSLRGGGWGDAGRGLPGAPAAQPQGGAKADAGRGGDRALGSSANGGKENGGSHRGEGARENGALGRSHRGEGARENGALGGSRRGDGTGVSGALGASAHPISVPSTPTTPSGASPFPPSVPGTAALALAELGDDEALALAARAGEVGARAARREARRERAARTARHLWAALAFALPACCDAGATTLLNAGLELTTPSAYQMLRGTLVVFAALLTVVLLRRRLHAHHWAGVLLIATGAAIVGVASAMGHGDDEGAEGGDAAGRGEGLGGHSGLGGGRLLSVVLGGAPGARAPALGNALVISAQALAALQFVIEERFLRRYRAPVLLAVGAEGIWGVLLCATLAPLVGTLPRPDWWVDLAGAGAAARLAAERRSATNALSGALGRTPNALSGALGRTPNALSGALGRTPNALSGALGRTPNALSGALGRTPNALSGALGRTPNALSGALGRTPNALSGALGRTPNALSGALGRTPNALPFSLLSLGRPIDSLPAAVREVSASRALQLTSVATVASIAAFNTCGVRVTRELSGTARAAIDATRTLLVWGASVALGWERPVPLQLVGFAVLLTGTSIYNELLRGWMPGDGTGRGRGGRRSPARRARGSREASGSPQNGPAARAPGGGGQDRRAGSEGGGGQDRRAGSEGGGGQDRRAGSEGGGGQDRRAGSEGGGDGAANGTAPFGASNRAPSGRGDATGAPHGAVPSAVAPPFGAAPSAAAPPHGAPSEFTSPSFPSGPFDASRAALARPIPPPPLGALGRRPPRPPSASSRGVRFATGSYGAGAGGGSPYTMARSVTLLPAALSPRSLASGPLGTLDSAASSLPEGSSWDERDDLEAEETDARGDSGDDEMFGVDPR